MEFQNLFNGDLKFNLFNWALLNTMRRAQPAQDSLAPSAHFEFCVFAENIKLKILTFWQFNDVQPLSIKFQAFT